MTIEEIKKLHREGGKYVNPHTRITIQACIDEFEKAQSVLFDKETVIAVYMEMRIGELKKDLEGLR